MIPVIIFYAHVIFIAYIFTKTYLDEGFVSGFLSIIFIVVIFSVGWTISEFIFSLFMKDIGLGLLFPRAAFSLMFLTLIETIFYRYYYGRKPSRVMSNQL
jgi:hypothetical protein